MVENRFFFIENLEMEFVDLGFKSRTQRSVILSQLSIAYFVMRWYCGDFPHFTAIFPASRQVLYGKLLIL